jgi:gamma-glutamyltranspeptidase/glutathione hydrolase
VLTAGGNAVDAGVAGGFTLGVAHPDMVSVAGVAPILVHLARTGETWQVSGVGPYPRASSREYFVQRHGSQIPAGLPRTVVPAAPDAWCTALERWGTMSFADVIAPALYHAERGFAVSAFSAYQMGANVDKYRRWPSSVALYLRDGRAYRMGEVLVQSELADTLKRMVAAEKRAGGSRVEGIRAARNEFYRGETAKRIAEFHRANEGPLALADLADFSVEVEPALRTSFGAYEIAVCGFWCQGPALLQALNILDGMDLAALGHNSPAYLHMIVESIKLAFSDRDAYYGDPNFVKIPAERLLSKAYGELRRAQIRRGGRRCRHPATPSCAAPCCRWPAVRPTRSTPATWRSSTPRATASRPRRAIPMSTRRRSPASAAWSRRAARRAGSIPTTPAWWRRASGPASRPRRPWRCPAAS